MNPIEIEIRTKATLAALDAARKEIKALAGDANAASTAAAQYSTRLNSSFGGVLASISPVALSMTGLTVATLGAVAAGISYNATLEKQTAAFRALLGSAEAAEGRMAALAEFANTTPFELTEVVEANRLLQSLTGGALATESGMRLVGDAAAAAGRTFQETAMWIGRLYSGLQAGVPVGEATMRLLEMGLVSGETARKLNVLAESGAMGTQAFNELEKVFAKTSGAMELQAKTLSGQFSTLKDTMLALAGESSETSFRALNALLRETLILLGAMPNASEEARANAMGQAGKSLQALRGLSTPEARESAQKMLQAELEAARAREAELKTRFDPRGLSVLDAFRGNSQAAREGRQVISADEIAELETLATRIRAAEAALSAVTGQRGQELVKQTAEQEKAAAIVAAENATIKEAQEWLKKNADTVRALVAEYEFGTQSLDRQLGTLRQMVAVQDDQLQKSLASATTEEQREAAKLRHSQATIPLAQKIAAIEDEQADQAERKARISERELDAEAKRLEIARQNQLALDMQLARSDWRSTPGQQRDAQLALGRDALGAGTVGTGDMALLENQLGPDPRSWGDSWTAMLVEQQSQNEAFAANFVSTIGRAYEETFAMAADGLTAAIFQTEGWQAKLADIPRQIGMGIVSAIIRMGLQWVATQILMATAGKAIQATATAGTAPMAIAASAMWATPATLATIASYGGAAAAAPGFIAIAQGITMAQSLAAFAAGGETPGTPTLAWVGEKGPELVIPAHVNAKLSPGQKASLVSGNIAAGGWPEGGSGAAAPGFGFPDNARPINISVFDDRQAMDRWMREHGETHVMEMMQRNWHRFSA